MKAVIVNPYMDTLGGGERYTLMFAKALHEFGYDIVLEWKDSEILKKAENRFGQDFGFIKIMPDVKRGDGCDLIFWVSDGSVPTLRSRKNILHFQVPFTEVNGKTLINKMKFFRIAKIVVNSNFTKRIIDKEFGVESVVLYPPVDTKNISPLKKENIILYVGRFSELAQSKRQDVLIEVFKKFYKEGNNNWRLILAGGTDVGTGNRIFKLKTDSANYPIDIIESPNYKKLVHLYGRSKIFWSAAGYDIEEKKEPHKMEHFGMTLVESMSAGCIPIVYDGGGHKEIVNNGKNGFLWQKKSELLSFTSGIIKDKYLAKIVCENAQKASKFYSYENFMENIKDILE